MPLDIENTRSMRDINDYCVANGLATLAQGMIELPPPRQLREIAGEVLMEDAAHCYRARMGEPDYLAGVEALLRDEGVTQPLEGRILATHGVTGAICGALMHLKHKLSRPPIVMLLEPFYTYHLRQIQATCGSSPVFLEACKLNRETGVYGLREELWAELKSKLQAGEADAVVMCNPQNPTGQVWKEEQLKKMVETVTGAGKLLIVDECYSDMAFMPHKHLSPISDLSPSVVVCRGFSKSLGAQSWRVGFAISHEDTIASIMNISDPVYLCTPILQHALGTFLKNHLAAYHAHVQDLNALLQRNWGVLKEAFSKRFGWLPIEPQGTMYGSFVHSSTSDLEATNLALEAGVGVCPGSMFTRQGINPTANTSTVRIHCGISAEKADSIAALLAKES